MKCLRCTEQELAVQVVGGEDEAELLEVDVCPTCGGMWLDSEELAKVDDHVFVNPEEITYAETRPSKDDKALGCPRCAARPTMRKVHPAGHDNVVVDTCPQCRGFWLDKGELEKLSEVSDSILIASLPGLDED